MAEWCYTSLIPKVRDELNLVPSYEPLCKWHSSLLLSQGIARCVFPSHTKAKPLKQGCCLQRINNSDNNLLCGIDDSNRSNIITIHWLSYIGLQFTNILLYHHTSNNFTPVMTEFWHYTCTFKHNIFRLS